MRLARRSIVLFGCAVALLATASSSPAPVNAQAAGFQEYVALGDSAAASAGLLPPPTTEFVPAGCAQQTYDYPHRVAAALGVPAFRDATCSGATTAHMTSSQVTPLGVNAPQFDRLTATTDLVTLTIGANDLSMGTVVPQCFNPLPVGSSPLCKTAMDAARAKIPATEAAIANVIAGIRQRSPGAQVVVVNYLTYFIDAGCWPVVPITPADSSKLRVLWNDMNAMLARAGASQGASLADAHALSIGHDICKSATVRWVEGLIPVSVNGLGVVFPFHPNSAGCAGQAAAALSVIGGLVPVAATTTTTTTTTTSTSVAPTTTTAATSTVPVTTAAPTTAAPTTAAPTTAAPTTEPPVTAAPTTTSEPPAPTTEGPTTTLAG